MFLNKINYFSIDEHIISYLYGYIFVSFLRVSILRTKKNPDKDWMSRPRRNNMVRCGN